MANHRKKGIMRQRVCISKRVHSTVYKALNIFKKSDKSVAHEVHNYLVDIRVSWKSQAIRPTLPLESNGLDNGLAEGLAE
jgi:hypothetical protein